MLAAVLVALACIAAPASATKPGTNGKIAFVAMVDGNRCVHVINPDGTDLDNLDRCSWNLVEWFPSGARLAIEALLVYSINPDGSDPQLIANTDVDTTGLSFSPAGTELAFSGWRVMKEPSSSSEDVYVTPLPGGQGGALIMQTASSPDVVAGRNPPRSFRILDVLLRWRHCHRSTRRN